MTPTAAGTGVEEEAEWLELGRAGEGTSGGGEASRLVHARREDGLGSARGAPGAAAISRGGGNVFEQGESGKARSRARAAAEA